VKRTACGLLLLSILLVPSLAFADFRFIAQNRANNLMCIYCGGPWFRLGFSTPLFPPTEENPNPVAENFYTAETNIFSPFGLWGCGVKVKETSTLVCDWQGIATTQENCLLRIRSARSGG
jgi:hypothetical protein